MKKLMFAAALALALTGCSALTKAPENFVASISSCVDQIGTAGFQCAKGVKDAAVSVVPTPSAE